jgi:hypothetical protein
LTKDASRNIAIASEPYSQAQDIASACRLFRSEAWFDTTRGIPYWERILGHAPPIGVIKSALNTAALTVPGINAAQSFIVVNRDRTVTGQVQASASGFTIAVNISVLPSGSPFIVAVSAIGGKDFV